VRGILVSAWIFLTLDSRYVFRCCSSRKSDPAGAAAWLAASSLICVARASIPLGWVQDREIRSVSAGAYAVRHFLFWYVAAKMIKSNDRQGPTMCAQALD